MENETKKTFSIRTKITDSKTEYFTCPVEATDFADAEKQFNDLYPSYQIFSIQDRSK